MTELKSCPFCGDTYVKVHLTKGYSFTVGCNTVNCICLHTEGKTFKTQEDAIKAWNRRVTDADSD